MTPLLRRDNGSWGCISSGGQVTAPTAQERLTQHVQTSTFQYMPNINLLLPKELLDAIDDARGDVPRVAWIRRAIQQRLDREKS